MMVVMVVMMVLLLVTGGGGGRRSVGGGGGWWWVSTSSLGQVGQWVVGGATDVGGSRFVLAAAFCVQLLPADPALLLLLPPEPSDLQLPGFDCGLCRSSRHGLTSTNPETSVQFNRLYFVPPSRSSCQDYRVRLLPSV